MDSTNSSSKDHTKPVMKKRCKYQVRWFYSKGAVLILLWTTLLSATFWSYITNLGQKFLKESYGEHLYVVLIALSSLTLFVIPLLGWLADAKLGNYKVFKFNCFSLLIDTIICGIHILYVLALKSIALQYTSAVVLVLVDAVGTAGAIVSITTALQLGLDQMPDASSTNISSFISWFVFSIFFGFWIADWLLSTLLYCIPLLESTKVQLFSLFPVTCTVIICSSMFLLAKMANC